FGVDLISSRFRFLALLASILAHVLLAFFILRESQVKIATIESAQRVENLIQIDFFVEPTIQEPEPVIEPTAEESVEMQEEDPLLALETESMWDVSQVEALLQPEPEQEPEHEPEPELEP